MGRHSWVTRGNVDPVVYHGEWLIFGAQYLKKSFRARLLACSPARHPGMPLRS